MGTGILGAFVISWSQTEIDGFDTASAAALRVGATWAWHGDAVRVDGPSDVLRLDMPDEKERLRKHAARTVHRLIGAASTRPKETRVWDTSDEVTPLMDNNFVVTDGVKTYCVTVIEIAEKQPLLLFVDQIPPRGCDLWIVRCSYELSDQKQRQSRQSGVICFTPGTRIRTRTGVSLIEDLREGDLVQTKDNGLQPLRWIGRRRMSGARLFAMPHLRPVRIRCGAFGGDRPESDLLVSPEHRMLIKGATSRRLFNTSEVLVAAKDLVNDKTITLDAQRRDVTYIHVLLEQHQVLWANGLETESFHPASAAFATLEHRDRYRLLSQCPDLRHDPHSYGNFARRMLSGAEAAIMMHAA